MILKKEVVMNVFKNIKEKLAKYSINHNLLEFNKNVDSFKKKIFIAPVTVLVLALWSGTSWAFYDNNLDGSFCLIILLGIILGTIFHVWLSSLKINGWFLKCICYLSKSRTLKSFINTTNYHDKIILDMFENSNINDEILEFYKIMSRINFSNSQPINNIYLDNEEISYNLNKMKRIVYYHDEKAFLKFFKNSFVLNFLFYCQHPNVITLLNNFIVEDAHSLNVQENNFLQTQDISITTDQHTHLKQKFKAAL